METNKLIDCGECQTQSPEVAKDILGLLISFRALGATRPHYTESHLPNHCWGPVGWSGFL